MAQRWPVDASDSDAYRLVYTFLTARKHDKAARLVERALKELLGPEGSMEMNGAPTLEGLLRDWKQAQSRCVEAPPPPPCKTYSSVHSALKIKTKKGKGLCS